MTDSTNELSNDGRTWGLSIAVIFGVWFLFFALGLVFGPRDPEATRGEFIVAVALTVWLAGMTVAGLGVTAKKRWADRFSDWLFGVAVLSIQCVLVVSTIDHNAPHAVIYYGIATWVGIGFLIYLGERTKETARPTYFDCALWPLLLLLKAPVAGICLLAVPAMLIMTGEWIGDSFHHPHIGAAIGFGLFVVLAIIVARQSSELTATHSRKPPNEPSRHRTG